MEALGLDACAFTSTGSSRYQSGSWARERSWSGICFVQFFEETGYQGERGAPEAPCRSHRSLL